MELKVTGLRGRVPPVIVESRQRASKLARVESRLRDMWRPGCRVRVLMAGWVYCVGCSKSPTGAQQDPGSTAAQASPTVSPSAVNPAVAPPAVSANEHSTALTEPGVRALVDAWLGAQNRADFASYERLYAERFTGVKRSAERARSLGRRAWMDDRSAMFRRPMQVGISDLTLNVTPSAARVRFEQTWSSGTYRDTGAKELLIVVGKNGPQIAREELLESKVAVRRGALRGGTDPTARILPMDVGLVLLSSGVEPEWSRGPLREATGDSDPGVMTVIQDVDESKLPPELSAMKNKPLRAIDAAGSSCDTRVVSFQVHGAVIPHFSFGRTQDDEGNPSPPIDAAREIWELSEHGGRSLVGMLEPPCYGLWALDAADPVPAVYEPAAATGTLARAALAAFQRLPSYARIERDYRQSSEAAPSTPWHKDPASARFEITVFTPKAGTALVLVAADAGEPCSDFSASLNSVFRLDRAPREKLTWVADIEGEMFDPVSAFDIDGDGWLELLSLPVGLRRTRAVMYKTPDGFGSNTLWQVPFLDCPC